MGDDANLWDYETNELTELGEAYFRHCKSTPQPQNLLLPVALCCTVLLLVAAAISVVVYWRKRAQIRSRGASHLFQADLPRPVGLTMRCSSAYMFLCSCC